MKLTLKRPLALALLTLTLMQAPAAAIYIEGQTPVQGDANTPMLMMATGGLEAVPVPTAVPLEIVPISAPVEIVPISAPVATPITEAVPIKAESYFISGYQAIDYMRSISLPQADWVAEAPELREENGRREWLLRFQEERMIKIYWVDLEVAVDADTSRITYVRRAPYAEREIEGEALTAEAAKEAALKHLPTLAPGLRALLTEGELVDGSWQFEWSQLTREWGPYVKGGTISVNAVTGALAGFNVN